MLFQRKRDRVQPSEDEERLPSKFELWCRNEFSKLPQKQQYKVAWYALGILALLIIVRMIIGFYKIYK